MVLQTDHILPGTYGIVACGGNSSRMGTDKSLLTYYNKPQRYHVYDMLQPFCENVFISCNVKQATAIEKGYSFITDEPAYHDIGPMAALLTAFTQFTGKNILLIGCDYPFLTAITLQQFLAECENTAISFYDEPRDLYQPLLAWYPYRLFPELKKMYADKEYSLQRFLRQYHALKFYPPDKNCMLSIDTKEDLAKIQHSINPS